MPERVEADHQATARTITARTQHYCGAHSATCQRVIRPGARYVRSVLFPGHDANGSQRPISRPVCFGCAARYVNLAHLVEEPADV